MGKETKLFLDLKSGKIRLDENLSFKDELSVLFAGDLCMRGRTEDAILNEKSSEILMNILPVLLEKDLSIVNLENPLTLMGTAITKDGPNIKANPKCIDILTQAGFNIASLANNHMGDFGPEPVIETINQLNIKEIMTVGAGKNLEEARKPLFFSKKGMRIAVLAFAENEFGIAEADKAGVAPLNLLSNISDIAEASSQSDITLVLIHGGNEFNPVPSPRMVETYRAFADAGATAVIGTHTHCPQGFEIYNGTPIIYSLGNFLFDARQSLLNEKRYALDSFWWKSYITKISFIKGKATSLEVSPFSFAPDATKINLLMGAEKYDFLKYLQYLSDIILEKNELEQYWHAWCGLMSKVILEGLTDKLVIKSDDIKVSKELVILRNLFTCEAHNELLKTYLIMVCDNRIIIDNEYIDKIRSLQKGTVPTSDTDEF